MDNIASKYNRFLISIFAVAPFVAYLTIVYFNMSFNRIMQVLSFVGVFLILIINQKIQEIRFPKYLVFYLMFIIYVFYSDLYRLNRSFEIEYLFSNKLIGSFNFMFIIENLFISKKYFKSILKVSKMVLIIATIVIIIQQVYSPSFFMRRDMFSEELLAQETTVRLYSIYTWFGTILSAGFSFVPIFLIIFEDEDRKNNKIIPWLLLGLIFVFLSKQRWVMLNFSLVFVLLFMSSHRRDKVLRFVKLFFMVPIVFVGMFYILNFIGIEADKIVSDRIFETGKKDISQKSAGTRILALKAFNQLYWDNPILGIGNIKYGMGGSGEQDYQLRRILKGRSSQIHVGYLSLFYVYGLIGAVLFLSFLFLLLRRLYKNAKKTSFWAPFLGILGVAIDNFVDVNFQFFIMGLILALLANSYYQQNYYKMELNA